MGWHCSQSERVFSFECAVWDLPDSFRPWRKRVEAENLNVWIYPQGYYT
jgi:hypothetical protein